MITKLSKKEAKMQLALGTIDLLNLMHLKFKIKHVYTDEPGPAKYIKIGEQFPSLFSHYRLTFKLAGTWCDMENFPIAGLLTCSRITIKIEESYQLSSDWVFSSNNWNPDEISNKIDFIIRLTKYILEHDPK